MRMSLRIVKIQKFLKVCIYISLPEIVSEHSLPKRLLYDVVRAVTMETKVPLCDYPLSQLCATEKVLHIDHLDFRMTDLCIINSCICFAWRCGPFCGAAAAALRQRARQRLATYVFSV